MASRADMALDPFDLGHIHNHLVTAFGVGQDGELCRFDLAKRARNRGRDGQTRRHPNAIRDLRLLDFLRVCHGALGQKKDTD
jgi:hypothetical protein